MEALSLNLFYKLHKALIGFLTMKFQPVFFWLAGFAGFQV